MELKNDKLRKGIYFSFDAVLALSVMTASLIAVTQLQDTTNTQFDQQTDKITEQTRQAQQVLTMANTETFESAFAGNPNIDTNEIIQETELTEEELDRPVMESILMVEAAEPGNQYTDLLVEEYFEPKINEEFQLVLSERQEYSFYETSEINELQPTVTSSSILVSGFELNESTTGFRSRASITKSQADQTTIEPIEPAGSLPDDFGLFAGGTFEVNQYVRIPEEAQNFENASIDLNTDGADTEFFSDLTVEINGEDLGEGTELEQQGDNAYRRYQIDGEDVNPGINELRIAIADFDIFSGFEGETFLNPGSRFRADYEAPPETTEIGLQREEINLKEVETFYSGGLFGEDQSGFYSTESFEVPENAEIENSTVRLNVEGLTGEAPEGWDIRARLNQETILEEQQTGTFNEEIDIEEEIVEGTNYIEIFANHDGHEEFWGEDTTRLVANPEEEDHSMVEIWYEETGIPFGELEATETVEFNEDTNLNEDDHGNPIALEENITYDTVTFSNLYISQFDSENPELSLNPASTVEFDGSEFEITPTLASINPENIEENQINEFILEDQDFEDAEFLTYSLLEYGVSVEPRVGYGDLFSSNEEAQQDAEERLSNKVGDLIDIEEIDADTQDIGGQPRIFGPAEVKLVKWEEQ